MRYKTLFRLLIKFFGVFLICEAIRGISVLTSCSSGE